VQIECKWYFARVQGRAGEGIGMRARAAGRCLLVEEAWPADGGIRIYRAFCGLILRLMWVVWLVALCGPLSE